MADLARLEAKYENDIEIARQERDFKIKDEGYNREIKTKVASAELAYDLQVAITKQTIKEEEMAIKITERAQEIKVQQEVHFIAENIPVDIFNGMLSRKFFFASSVAMIICLFLKEIARQEKVLDANVKIPADASKYEIEKLAEADLKRTILEAEATAEAIRVCIIQSNKS